MPRVTRWGTSYFVSRRAAERYFRHYHYEDIKATITRKLAEGDIHIGKPPLEPGDKLSVIPGEGRYQIEALYMERLDDLS